MYKTAHADLKILPSVCAKPYIEMQFRSHEAVSLAHAISGVSAFGTFRTCEAGLAMSVQRGKRTRRLRTPTSEIDQFGHWRPATNICGGKTPCRCSAFGRSRRLLWSAHRRSFAGKHAAGDGDVLATGLLGHVHSLRQGASLTHLRQLDQHGKIDSCEHVHIWTAHAGNSKVGRRAAEHVGENGNAVTAIDAIHRFSDRPSTQIRVIVGSNCDGFHLLLAAHELWTSGCSP